MKKKSLLVLLLSVLMVLSPALCAFADSEEEDNSGEGQQREVVVDSAEDEDVPATVEEPASEKPVAEEPAKEAPEEQPALRGGKSGWYQDEYGDWYYYKPAGVMIYGWKYIGNYWYYFDEHLGYMHSGGSDCIGGDWYYFDDSGHMKTGWVKEVDDDGDVYWFYYKSNGKQAWGWQKIGGKWYYFPVEAGGAMSTGWWEIGDKWYFFDYYSGVMKTGWLKDTWTDEEEGGDLYYLVLL